MCQGGWFLETLVVGERADALGHRDIDSPHLMLGVLRMEDSVAAQLLRKRGVEYEQFRHIVARGERADPAPGPPAPVAPEAAWLKSG